MDPHADGTGDGGADGNVPGGTSDPACGAKAKRPLSRTLRVWATIGVLYGAFAAMAVGGALLVRKALGTGMEWDDRLMYLAWAVALLAPVFFLARYFVRLRLRTGRWRGTPEQRKLDREARLAKACGTGRLSACGTQRTSWGKMLMAWASSTAMDRSRHAGERAAAWLVLVGYVLLMLGLAALGVIAIGAAFDSSNTLTQSLLFVGLGLVVLAIPAVAAWKLIRGIRHGKVGTTREDLEAMRAQNAAWRARESQKPLRSKLMNTAVMLMVYGVWWLRVLLPHGKRHAGWVEPAMAMPFLVYLIYVQFRPPRASTTGAAGRATD